MDKGKKKYFAFSKDVALQRGSRGGEVAALQSILVSLGYLRGSYEPGALCHCTERAVRRYQRFYGLKVDGIVGPKTKALLEQPRCGVPDLPTNLLGATPGAPFVLRGCKYNVNQLTYAFLNGTNDLASNADRQIVRSAFDAWANVSHLRFAEVQPNQNPNFRIAWRSGNHGDGNSFDGPGNTLAHAFFPPPCGGPYAGDLHFDEDERWIEDPAGQGIVLRQVAIHEIGHLLGLSHSEDQRAIMFAYYSADRVNLSDDDVQGIQALYGEPDASRQVLLSAEATGNLTRIGDKAVFDVEVPGTLAVSIDGPANADFDLYVRKGEPPTLEQWDYRAYTVSSDETIAFPVEAGARYYVMVRSYDGSGNFKLKVQPSVA